VGGGALAARTPPPTRPWLLLVDAELDATVLSPPVFGLVAGDRLRLTETHRGHAAARDPAVCQIVGDGIGPALGQALIVGVAADRIGMTLDRDRDPRLLFQCPDGSRRAPPTQ
jgi:hypothetical protein